MIEAGVAVSDARAWWIEAGVAVSDARAWRIEAGVAVSGGRNHDEPMFGSWWVGDRMRRIEGRAR